MSRQVAGFSRALARMVRAINSDIASGEKLNLLVRLAPQALAVRGCSLLLLDSQKKRLIHTAVHGLSERYLRKGFIEPERSLSEAVKGEVVTVPDAASDPRVQFRELAKQEHIVSIMGVPVTLRGSIVGSLRVYSRAYREFTASEQQFLSTVADLVGIVLESDHAARAEEPPYNGKTQDIGTTGIGISLLKPTSFAHPSEEEFAKLLDFYQIEWLYEPRSFPLQWEEGRVTEMFTPDFYLPDLDLYLEMTTMKPALTKEKKQKIRRMRELYPDINVMLLARRDYDRLLAKYGYGPLAGAKTHGVGKVLFSNLRIQRKVRQLAKQISQDYEGRHPVLIGVLRGVFCFMADLMRSLTVPADVDFMSISYYEAEKGGAVRVTKEPDINMEGRHVILVEDIVDTGMTLSFVLAYLRKHNPASLAVCTLLDKNVHRLADVRLDYVGFEVPDEFLVGYGLDYAEEYRNLPFIALLQEAKDPNPDEKKNLG
ncbi:MAG: hypoxanthine phosphoribosyltransferase [Chloroflexi bacterium]|nr:MAG: hypoxanthine phosphoribosyltransferase [Chloroflexota bacterium]